MITSSTERLASYPVATTAAQNEHDGEISSPGAALGAAIMPPQNPSDLAVDGSPWTIRFGTTVR